MSDPPDLTRLLTALCALPGPTGDERAVTDWVAERWGPLGEVTRSPVGNLLLRLPGSGPRLLLAAHADELSLMVRSVGTDGFLRVIPGERDQFSFPTFIGAAVRVLAPGGEIPGVVATTTGHAMTPEQRELTRYGWNDLFVDVGLSADECLGLGIGIGTRIVWDAPVRPVGRLLMGKAMDDRLGVAALVETARRVASGDRAFDVTFALTVQEEIGTVGSSSLTARGRDYDLAVVVDNGLAGDIPTTWPGHMPVRLGEGPALVVRDSSVHYSPRLIGALRGVADRNQVPVQSAILYHYMSDGGSLVRQGVETALVAPPIRYSHSPFEAVDPADLAGTVRLLECFIRDGLES
jgi:putative aminopeptidase FrvX